MLIPPLFRTIAPELDSVQRYRIRSVRITLLSRAKLFYQKSIVLYNRENIKIVLFIFWLLDENEDILPSSLIQRHVYIPGLR